MMEGMVIGALGVWWVVALLCSVRTPGLMKWVSRHNSLQWMSRWELFTGMSPDPKEAFAAYELDFQDAAHASAGWRRVAPPPSWRWHDALFDSRRLIAARIESLCSLFRLLAPRAAEPAIARRLRLLETVLSAHAAHAFPTAQPAQRSFRIVRRTGNPADDRVLWIFTAPGPGAAS